MRLSKKAIETVSRTAWEKYVDDGTSAYVVKYDALKENGLRRFHNAIRYAMQQAVKIQTKR